MPPRVIAAPDRPARWRRRFLVLAFFTLVLPAALALYLLTLLRSDEPVDYADDADHFKYGSTGGERVSGFPYWIWQAMPQVCAEHLPGKGYASLGMIYEQRPDGTPRDLPVGTAKRRFQGIDRVFLNCAACHVSTVRLADDKPPLVVTGMPANTFDIMAFEKFFFRCVADPKFTPERIVPEIQRLGGRPNVVERQLVYPVAIALMRDRILQLAGRFDFVWSQHDWGPGRVDTFNSAKVLFNFPMTCKEGSTLCIDPKELDAPGDFPAIWNQEAKQGMRLHWDGNNTKVEERNKSAAFGTGTTPPTIDLDRIGRVERWLAKAEPPAFRQYFPIDEVKAARGAALYGRYCASCHGASGRSFALPAAERVTGCVRPGETDEGLYGPRVGKITRWDEIRTDRRRLDSYSRELALNQSTLYAGYDWRFCHFRKTDGYANAPLDGLWLRAPYLHNGSVPTLRDLLEPAASRPPVFFRGDDRYDPVRVGFVSDKASDRGRIYFEYDTQVPGNSNAGHEGRAYGTELAADEKDALVEFLKTF